MSQDVIVHDQPAAHAQPFGAQRSLGSAVNQGAIAIEQERAIAEAQGQLILAKRFPRSMAQAHADFMEACKSPEFSAKAFYSVPNRGSGPSIRFMEEAARCYGNFVYGHRELSRSEGKSEIEVYAWDMEKNNRSTRQITVMHIVDTKNGPKKLVDQADIDNKIANVASKQVRGRIAALLPKALLEAGQVECRKTLAGNNEKPISQRVRDMTGAFSKYGVTIKHLEAYIGHGLDDTTLDELIDLTGVFNALREGAKASEYFGEAEQAIAADKAVDKVAEIAAKGAAAKAASKNSKPDEKPSKPVKEPAVAVNQNEPANQEVQVPAQQPEPSAEVSKGVDVQPVQQPAQQEAAKEGEGDLF